MIASPAAENCKRLQVAGSLILSLRSLGAGAANAQRSRFEAALARFAASSGNKALRRSVFALHGVAEGVERRRRGRVNFRADIRTGNRIDLITENPPGGQAFT
jgi:hypothetical protein